jgi:hypothetical protein
MDQKESLEPVPIITHTCSSIIPSPHRIIKIFIYESIVLPFTVPSDGLGARKMGGRTEQEE